MITQVQKFSPWFLGFSKGYKLSFMVGWSIMGLTLFFQYLHSQKLYFTPFSNSSPLPIRIYLMPNGKIIPTQLLLLVPTM
jgi:hypothetical protein